MAYIASIGFFDGVHLGHISVIEQLKEQAARLEMSSLLVTFSAHPRAVTEGVAPPLLLGRDERIQRLKRTAVTQVLELDFNAVRDYTAEAFMQWLHEQYDVEALLMGYDHRFGSDRMSKIADYQAAGARAGVEVYLAEQAKIGDISSTKIRRALEEGRLEEANRYLGYNYTLKGEVVHGQHIGTEIGFPTANLMTTADSLIPKPGVYAAMMRGQKAIVNIGNNPTFGEDRPLSVEVHIPGFEGDLYGQTLEVELLEYIRSDQRFDSLTALIKQIEQDLKHLDHLFE